MGHTEIDVNDFLDMKNEEILKENNGKKFDIVLMNPPYDGGLGERFFKKILQISNISITIQPTTWLFGKKQNKNITNELKDKYCDITIINPKDFDAGFLSKVSINYIDNIKDKDIILHNELTNKEYKYENIEDISELSLDELLSKFNDIVISLYENDNLENHSIITFINNNKEKLINQNLYLVRYSGIRGHGMSSNNELNPDFYTIISNNKKEQQEKVLLTTNDLKDENRKANFVFAFKSKDEQLNLLNYLQTDFCRACLATIKNNQHLDRGELKRIPWFDFSDDHFSKTPKEIDDWLFKKYNISNDIRKHIEEILPDYYGIRK